jgi:hypothetical protein
VLGVDPFQHAVGATIESVGGHQHTPQALVSPLITDFRRGLNRQMSYDRGRPAASLNWL